MSRAKQVACVVLDIAAVNGGPGLRLLARRLRRRLSQVTEAISLALGPRDGLLQQAAVHDAAGIGAGRRQVAHLHDVVDHLL